MKFSHFPRLEIDTYLVLLNYCIFRFLIKFKKENRPLHKKICQWTEETENQRHLLSALSDTRDEELKSNKANLATNHEQVIKHFTAGIQLIEKNISLSSN